MSDLVEQIGAGDVGEAASSELAVTPAPVIALPSEPTVTPVTSRRARPRRSAEDESVWRAVVDEWHRLVAEASASRGPLPTVRGFCDERKIREPSFYWLRREFAIRDGKPLPTRRFADSTRIPSHLGAHAPSPATKPAFVQLRIKPSSQVLPSLSNALCELDVGKFVVRVSPGFDADELSRLLEVLTDQTR